MCGADKQACGTLTVASNMLLLAMLKGVKTGLRLGLRAGTTLFIRPEATYTATLHTSSVRQFTVTIVSTPLPPSHALAPASYHNEVSKARAAAMLGIVALQATQIAISISFIHIQYPIAAAHMSCIRML
jgi:hypothetical protein